MTLGELALGVGIAAVVSTLVSAYTASPTRDIQRYVSDEDRRLADQASKLRPGEGAAEARSRVEVVAIALRGLVHASVELAKATEANDANAIIVARHHLAYAKKLLTEYAAKWGPAHV